MTPIRVLLAGGGIITIVAGALFAASKTVSLPLSLSIPSAIHLALVYILMLGTFYEWIVHRFIYHHPSKYKLLNDIYLIHEKGHHWHRFPPTHYVEEGPLDRIPVVPATPLDVCRSAGKRFIAWLGQYMLYMTVAVPFSFVPAWYITRNLPFTTASVLIGMVVCFYFIRVHDVMHYPGLAPRMEKQRWFQFLDRHHYIHHIDNQANLNFLLPLFDLMVGTMRTTLTAEEQATWPAFEEAKVLVQKKSTDPQAITAA